MSHNWKSNQFINYENSIGKKTLKYIGKGCIKINKLIFETILSSMRYNYKSSETFSEQKIIQIVYNLLNLSVNSIVIVLKNNISAQVVNEADIITSIRLYLRVSYSKNNSEMEKFNDTLNMKKFDTLLNNVHRAWCAHLIKYNDKNYDVSRIYDLSNQTKVLVKKRNMTTTSKDDSFHGRCNVLSALLTPFKLKVYNCSHRHHCESVVHNGSVIEIIIPKLFYYFL